MISYHKIPSAEKPLFSILIPSWNNLPFLRLCIESIKKNSAHRHQIIVHVNEGNDGTIKYLENNKIDYTRSAQNVGICLAVNSAFSLADADYIVYMNDDMYACPDWDKYLYEEIKQLGTDYFFLSATMIEPRDSGNKAVIAPYNYGRTPDTFDEQKLLSEFNALKKSDWSGASWPPNLVHRRLWELIGGFSIEFSPGMYSDPDFSMKLYKAGVRIFKGVGKSRVYHFQSASTGRVKKNNGRKQFLLKWGISASTLYKKILNMGANYQGEVTSKEIVPGLKDRLKRVIQVVSGKS